MRIDVERSIESQEATLSHLRIDGRHFGWGLENGFRPVKQAGQSRIPAGLYSVRPRHHGGFHQCYQVRFPDWHRGMLEITRVPGFTDILIHIGNSADDTAGCLLVGAVPLISEAGTLRVAGSTGSYSGLYRTVIDEAQADRLEIRFQDRITHTLPHN